MLEIEYYRREMLDLVGRTIDHVECPDPWWIRRAGTPADVARALVGAQVVAIRRHGKLLLIDISHPSTGRSAGDGDPEVLGLRFGMTGRPMVDDRPPPFALEYASSAVHEEWVRFHVEFVEGGQLRILDPRRLGAAELDPDVSALGVDAWEIGRSDIDGIIGTSSAAIKSVLLDQSRVAGLGNMLVDEVLWRAGIDPSRRAGTLSTAERSALTEAVRGTLPELFARGGSHLGDLPASRRVVDATCPRDGAVLRRTTVGGRTTYMCPEHQR